jgi:hypothetical protein
VGLRRTDAMDLWPDVVAEAYAFVDRITPR